MCLPDSKITRLENFVQELRDKLAEYHYSQRAGIQEKNRFNESSSASISTETCFTDLHDH